MTGFEIAALVGTGALAGLIAGFLGLGGGAVLTPLCLLVYPALGVPENDLIKIIFGTNMFLVTVFSISAVLRHHQNRNIIWRTVLFMGPLAIVGALIGGRIATLSSPIFLKRAFAALLLFSSILIMVRGSTKPSGYTTDNGRKLPERLLPVLGFITGMLGSMLGIGGGAVMIMPLILLFKLPVGRVAGTSSSVIIFIGIAGTISYMLSGQEQIALSGWRTGYVWWSAALPLAIGGIPMAQAGAWLNNRLHAQLLKRIFGFALFVIAINILF